MIKLKKDNANCQADKSLIPEKDGISEVVSSEKDVTEDAVIKKDNLPVDKETKVSDDISDDNEKKKEVSFGLNRKSFLFVFAVAAFSIVFYWLLNHATDLKHMFDVIYGFLSPVILGGSIAFVINVPMCGLEKLWRKLFAGKGGKFADKARRPVCLFLSLVLVAGFIFLVLFMILPEFARSLGAIVEAIPGFVADIEKNWSALLDFAREHGASLPDFNIDAKSVISVIGPLFSSANGIVNKTVDFTGTILSGVADFLVAFVFAVYILAGKEKLARNFKKLTYAYLPEKRADSAVEIASLTHKTFFGFVTGQLTESVIIGVLCFAGMNIFGFPYPVAISVLVGMTALIPVVGAFIGTGIGALLMLISNHPIKALWFIVFIIVLQQLEGNLIYPKVVGKSVGLPGIWVLVSVAVFGKLFGIAGMLVSVPICAVAYSLLRRSVYDRIKKRKIPWEKLETPNGGNKS